MAEDNVADTSINAAVGLRTGRPDDDVTEPVPVHVTSIAHRQTGMVVSAIPKDL